MSSHHPDGHDSIADVVMSVGSVPVILFALVPVHAQYSVVFLHQIIPTNELALQTSLGLHFAGEFGCMNAVTRTYRLSQKV